MNVATQGERGGRDEYTHIMWGLMSHDLIKGVAILICTVHAVSTFVFLGLELSSYLHRVSPPLTLVYNYKVTGDIFHSWAQVFNLRYTSTQPITTIGRSH